MIDRSRKLQPKVNKTLVRISNQILTTTTTSGGSESFLAPPIAQARSGVVLIVLFLSVSRLGREIVLR